MALTRAPSAPSTPAAAAPAARAVAAARAVRESPRPGRSWMLPAPVMVLPVLGWRRATRNRGSRCLLQATVEVETPVETPLEVSPAKVDALKSLLKDVLEVKPPRQLDTFLQVLQASGYTILEDWREIGGDLHPFLLPVATRGEFDDDLEVCGLLIRTPNGKQLRPDEWQVVTQQPRKTKVVKLVALDISRYIVKQAEEATFRNKKQDLPIIEITKDVYDVRFKGEDRNALDKWLLLEVGAFPDVYKNLAMEHISNGDPMTGLVIADTMRETFGYDWAFPHAFVSSLLNSYFNGKKEMENRTIEASTCLHMMGILSFCLCAAQYKQ
ncbi:unnamed protein product [Symbiodinium natans]|uniref:Uncharacterized protein n=1 Tax=Symbiodinium natans TaxID=878477 RepID=A0A812IL52_9DINO|nr:unnamed protein product [Symbiodinium natans]